MKFILLDSNQLIIQCWKHHYQTCLKIVHHYNLSLKPITASTSAAAAEATTTTTTPSNPNEFEFYGGNIEDFVFNQTLTGNTSTVTPTNSLSYMGGGYDKYLLQSMLLGTNTTDYKTVEHLIQESKLQEGNGYLIPNHIYMTNLLQLPVYRGYNYRDSLMYQNLRVSQIIQIPTMVVPEKIHSVSHLFDSMWSLLSHVRQYNGKREGGEDVNAKSVHQIDNLIIPGIGTGYGHLNEYESTKIMIFAIFLFNLDLGSDNYRLNQLKKSLLILFFFNKDYRLFKNHQDIQELESLVSDYGKNVEFKSDSDSDSDPTVMELDEVFKCIKF
ncbi:hypothetical protein CANMA_005369 [Candida margitis]|uniref:uncharacterized protein n=1 Tax=Candida margitis TaxID=1775924 RepID=UPI0022266F90|nr:uncharacterized protein CANMA_005369 [Candida margitis]KAI5950314.1 hypothetical protein CANMA_005369 [Candida margitis]